MRFSVKLLTIAFVVSLTSCAYIKQRTLYECKTHAYVETVIEDYLSRRYQSTAPVRMGIIPLVVSVNLTQKPFQYRGLGNELAYQIQAHFLNRETVPIVEVLNREDWPGKKDEFYTGNFGALSQAREAGYDLILVGIVDDYNPTTEIVASTKVIEVESGITLWYGKTTSHTISKGYQRTADYLGIEEHNPSKSFGTELSQELTKCIANEILSTNRLQ
jgi:hypothetical protein